MDSSVDSSGATVGILVCDHVVGDELVAAAEGRDYPDMYAEMLQAAEPSLRVKAFDVVNGEVPSSPAECDAWIITGARHDAHADEPWVVALRAFIVELREHRARTVGVCFGHQAVAHALGGESGPAGEWKAGPHELTVAPSPWFEGGTVQLNAMHRDVVHRLPEGAVALGTGSTAEHPMYVIDDFMLGVQDHPEFDDRYTAALIEVRRDRIGSEGADEALGRVERVQTDGDVVGRWIVDFLLDRRSRP